MNITGKIVCGIALVGITIVPVMAGNHGGHHRDHGNDGVRLAAEIVGLVREALAPAPVICHPAPPPPPAPPRHHHRVHHPAPRHEFRAPAPRHNGHRH